ncbi:MAG: NTP transferase domain-containing protein [Proteobacteria bacterium]|nr:NTP transferase domain-containing protein [Pseudomonadota bacterium]
MQFGSCPADQAQGAILAHSVRAGEKILRKGRVLSEDDVAALRAAGVREVVVARLQADDIAEDEAASRIAARVAGEHVRIAAAFTGRANLYAGEHGLAVIDAERVNALNAVHEAITLATVMPYAHALPRQMLATVKIIPFALPRAAVEQAEQMLASPIVRLAPFVKRRMALISTALPQTKSSILDKNRTALDARVTALGSQIVFERRVSHDTAPLAEALEEAREEGADPILVFGASAITDRRDVIPAAIEKAGGSIQHFGMPVDPGNLLLLGTLEGATVVGLPGCARSPKLNGFDFVLWRLVAGLPVDRGTISAMGVGGLLNEIPTRPQPRDERPAAVPRAPKIAAVVLAAGTSSRMGSNKLLADVRGKPMLRHAVEAALASHAEPVLVVTGYAGDEVKAALKDLNVRFAENPDFSKGLSASLKCGVSALPEDCDGALIILGDMPGISAALLDKLIAAFDPAESRAIAVATWHGKQGNPVLWARRFFPEILAIEGDVGARNLIGAYGELVVEVEAEDDAPLTDIDTPDALAAYARRSP